MQQFPFFTFCAIFTSSLQLHAQDTRIGSSIGDDTNSITFNIPAEQSEDSAEDSSVSYNPIRTAVFNAIRFRPNWSTWAIPAIEERNQDDNDGCSTEPDESVHGKNYLRGRNLNGKRPRIVMNGNDYPNQSANVEDSPRTISTQHLSCDCCCHRQTEHQYYWVTTLSDSYTQNENTSYSQCDSQKDDVVRDIGDKCNSNEDGDGSDQGSSDSGQTFTYEDDDCECQCTCRNLFEITMYD